MPPEQKKALRIKSEGLKTLLNQRLFLKVVE